MRNLLKFCEGDWRMEAGSISVCHVEWKDYKLIIAELRRLAWSGVPSEVRPIAWQLLLVSSCSVQLLKLTTELLAVAHPAKIDNLESEAKRVLSIG